MNYIYWIAKAVTAFIVAGLGAVATYNLDLPSWVLVLGSALVAALAVFLVPNGEQPE